MDLNGSVETQQGIFYPLQLAIVSGTKEIIDLLLQAGAVMNETVEASAKKHIDSSESTTKKAKERFEYAKKRLKALPVPIKQLVKKSGQEFFQPFVLSIKNVENREMLKNLIDEGVDVNTIFTLTADINMTPLQLAILLGDQKVIDMLIDTGASLDREITDEKGNKKSIWELVQQSVELGEQLTIKGRENLAYVLRKLTL